MNNNKNKAPKD